MSEPNCLCPPDWRGLALPMASIPKSPAAHLAIALVAGRFHHKAIYLACLAKDLPCKRSRELCAGERVESVCEPIHADKH